MSCEESEQRFGPATTKVSDFALENVGNSIAISIILIFIIPVCFILLNLICEELLIPTLNVLCDRLKISDETANSTLLAAGSSLPQFFSSIISLFITSTNIGIGITIGSSFFNQLCTISAVLYNSKSGQVYVKDRVFLRDVSFYILSLFTLVFALKGSLSSLFDGIDTPHDSSCLTITWKDTLLLLSIWLIYALVCANYTWLVKHLCPSKYDNGGDMDYHLPPMTMDASFSENYSPALGAQLLSSSFNAENVDDINGEGMNESNVVENDDFFACFIYRKNKFYSKFFSHRAWDRRWIICYKNECRFRYCSSPERPHHKAHEFLFDGSEKLEVIDEFGHVFKLSSGKNAFCPLEIKTSTSGQFYAICSILNQRIAESAAFASNDVIRTPIPVLSEELPMSEVSKVLRQPEGSSHFIFFHRVIYPFKYMLYLTTIDIRLRANKRNDTGQRRGGSFELFTFNYSVVNSTNVSSGDGNADDKYDHKLSTLLVSLILSAGWLFLVCYVMNISAAVLARIIGLSSGVMGLTIVAFGTSLPGIISAVTLSKQGQGGLVITNMLCPFIYYLSNSINTRMLNTSFD